MRPEPAVILWGLRLLVTLAAIWLWKLASAVRFGGRLGSERGNMLVLTSQVGGIVLAVLLTIAIPGLADLLSPFACPEGERAAVWSEGISGFTSSGLECQDRPGHDSGSVTWSLFAFVAAYDLLLVTGLAAGWIVHRTSPPRPAPERSTGSVS